MDDKPIRKSPTRTGGGAYVTFLMLVMQIVACGGGGSGGGTPAADTGQAPVATFAFSTDSGAAPLSVTFDATAATDADGAIIRYDWQFGDGDTAAGAIVTHTYTAAGTYSAALTVTDDDGLTDSLSHAIVVATPPAQTFTVNGTVTSAAYVIADSDVNDTNTTPVANDSFAEAQAITAPATVSGYVNIAGAGENGNSRWRGDPEDYYRLALTRGMTIALYMVEDPRSAELNIYLYDSQTALLDATATDDENGIASLTVPQDGTYFVRVQALSAAFIRTATVYTLTLGRSTSAARYAPRLSDAFVPGEALVRLDAPDGGTLSSLAEASTVASGLGLVGPADASGRDRLLRPADAVDRATRFAALGVGEAVDRSLAAGTMDSRTRAKLETLWLVRALRAQSGVRFAEPNYIRKPLTVPDDDYYSRQWHYSLINLPDAWAITTGSSDVVVAVVDTGVLRAHPDLAGQLEDGYDFISDPDIALDGDGIDADPDDPGDRGDVDGSSFHGTHVAGTIAAASNNGIGVAGVAWNARILPLRALGYGGGTSYDIIQAVKYAAGLETAYAGVRRDRPVDVINLSLGGDSASQTEAAVFQEVRDQGVIVIAAAGNSGSTANTYPAAYDGVVSVSAVTIDEAVAAYSNTGSTIDVAAPGGSSTDSNGDGYMDGVLSTIGDDGSGTIAMGYAFSIGTSMAAPHVSGVVALMKSLFPAMTPEQFDALLQGGYLTRDLGDPNWDSRYGYGLIDAHKAVLIAREGGGDAGIPAVLSVSPGNLSFGGTRTAAVVTVENSGNPEALLSISVYRSDADWLSVAPSADVDDQGLGSYTVAVDRGGLADGAYGGTVTFESNRNSAQVSVVMQVGTATATADGGYHYILLLDADTRETRAQIEGSGDNGAYPYSFSGLSYGDTYVIYAGTDPNNDRYICDDGEACGAYLSLDKPVVLTIQADMDDLDFSTDIIMNLPTAAAAEAAIDRWPLQRLERKGVAP